MWNASRFCVSSLRRGHANLLCIVPILVYVLPKQVHQGEQKIVRTFEADVGMVFITGRKDSLRVVKPAFKEQIWFPRLENAQITNPNFSPSFSQHFTNYLKYFVRKSAQNKEIRV